MNKLKIIRELKELLEIYNNIAENPLECFDDCEYKYDTWDILEILHKEIHDRMDILVPEKDDEVDSEEEED